MNTLAMIDKLKEAGVPETQARAYVEVIQDAQNESDVATKRDLREAVLELKSALAETKASLARQSIGAIVAVTAIFSLISKW